MARPIPMVLLTGFLGAGKTTLLNRLIAWHRSRPERLALLINEFGRASVDAQAVEPGRYDLREVNKGSLFCICVKTDLMKALMEIAAIEPPVDLLVAEASGLAETSDLSSYLDEPPLAGRFRIVANVCLADAAQFHKVFHTLRAARRQVEEASLVLLNKADLADAERRAATRALLAQLNPRADILETVRAAAPLEALVPRWLAGPEWRSARPPSTRPPESVVSATLEWRGALRRAALEAFLGSLPPLLRGKGLARLEDGRRWRFDWAGAEWVWEPAPDAPGRDSAILMLAAERLDEAALQAAFESCAAQNA